MFPRSGGVYVFLREAYGELPAFLYGWVALLVVISGGIAGVAVGFAEYLSFFVPRFPRPGADLGAEPLGGLRHFARSARGCRLARRAGRGQLRRRPQRQHGQFRADDRESSWPGGAAVMALRRRQRSAGIYAGRSGRNPRVRSPRSASR